MADALPKQGPIGQSPAAASADDGGDTTEDSSSFGITVATALIMGSVIGTGIFALPSALAPYGPISIFAFVLASVGAVTLALTFGRLSKRIPQSGGPYVYARDAFGDLNGFINAWSYWITAWAGNSAIAVAWVGYVEVFINTGHNKGWTIIIAMFGLWIPAFIYLTGLKNLGVVQVVTTILKFIPLLFMATVGLLFIKTANFGEFNISGTSWLSAISATVAITFFGYIGIETASVVAGRVRNPDKNVPRATILGTLLCAVVYIGGTITVFGTVSNSALQASTSPFSDSANAIFGGTWAGNTVAIAAVISGLGALVGWTLIIAEMPYAAAKGGLFPEKFAQVSKKNKQPVFAMLVSTILASLLVVVAYTQFSSVFTMVVLLGVFTAVIPYLFSAAAQMYWLFIHGRVNEPRRFVRDLIVSAIAMVFCYWALAGSGYQTVYYGVICMLLGIPVYIYVKYRRKEYGETAVIPMGEPGVILERTDV
ncbi:MAG: amino acid permease [Actinomycetes bacterium]